jgi:hypothetical protein
MAISTEDRDYLVTLIDLRTCIATNDVSLAERARDALNAMESSDDQSKLVNDALYDSELIANGGSADAYRVIINGVDCVNDKEHKLAVLDAAALSTSKDADEISAWLDQNVPNLIDFSDGDSPRAYATLLIRMCTTAKRYDKMDEVRAKLEEVD